MSKKLLIDARLADETRIVILNQDTIEDVDYESSHRKLTKGNIYLTKVTRVEPSLQACFVEYGGNRQGFLAFNEIHPDYYRIPVEDRQRLLDEEKQKALALAKADADSDPDSSTTPSPNNEAESSDARLDSIADIASDDSRPRHRFEKFRRQYSIQEVISRNQIMLVQVAKEERGNKGAAMTTYLSLAGRYSVLMPNTYHSGGISRKISDTKDRKKLKSIINSLTIPHGMAVIARTAGSGRTKTEFTRDYNHLLGEWENVRELTLKSSAPTLIYEGANLIKRAVRDYYASDVSEIIVQGEDGYKAARTHMKHLSPTHVKKVKEYKSSKNADKNLFQHYNIEQMLAAMH
ncbi:MAG: ribonuclease E/G, partial [Proteobacteria bacterium]|nr:ribonuclease E/G [Pseudomonadota bacterium]